MTTTTQTRAGQAELEAARLLLERMGVTPEQLLQTATPRPAAPTFAAYLPVVEAAVGEGTRRVYGSYWKRLVEHWGQRPIDEPTPLADQATVGGGEGQRGEAAQRQGRR